jgi:hypothetical protein
VRLIAPSLVVVLACGSAKPVAQPARIDPQRLAGELHADLVELDRIARAFEGQCSELVAALQPLIVRMNAHATQVDEALVDDALAKRLREEVRRFDEADRGVADRAGTSLATSYLTCKDERIKRVVDLIPVL